MSYKVGIFPRIDAIIGSIKIGKPWKAASTSEAGNMYQIRAAMKMNIYQPFSEEQKALNQYLTDRQAGLRLCDYAWRLFAQSLD